MLTGTTVAQGFRITVTHISHVAELAGEARLVVADTGGAHAGLHELNDFLLNGLLHLTVSADTLDVIGLIVLAERHVERTGEPAEPHTGLHLNVV